LSFQLAAQDMLLDVLRLELAGGSALSHARKIKYLSLRLGYLYTGQK